MAAALRWLLGAGATGPAVEMDANDDEVIPAFVLDDTPTNRGIMMSWTMKFDDVLDPEKLHSSLERLLSIGNWRKIGGRLRLNVGKAATSD